MPTVKAFSVGGHMAPPTCPVCMSDHMMIDSDEFKNIPASESEYGHEVTLTRWFCPECHTMVRLKYITDEFNITRTITSWKAKKRVKKG